MELSQKYRNQIYAGVLGKLIGVYLGRPVEGWPYASIQERFGEVSYYVHRELGLPLIVADDDISGTFAFFRAVEDNGFPSEISPEMIGRAWLNYIIEGKTILWWGGMGNSTEHTAYLNLKRGIPAPESGSSRRNGPVLSQQIGAQIFMDAYAMMCPGDPERANRMTRSCASVSHDGVAVDAAGFLGALEAAAFDEKNLGKLFDACTSYIRTGELRTVVDDVRNLCAAHSDWREVRQHLDRQYGYRCYPGSCPMIPNHAMVLASILCGGDDFARSIRIAASAGWDTDCNAGNTGCFNGIRLGLEGLEQGPDFRGPVADQMLVITSDGGEGVTDAVRETQRIVRAAEAARGSCDHRHVPRFSFEFPGSVQGFLPCPNITYPQCIPTLSNGIEGGMGSGLRVRFPALAEGVSSFISTATFLDVHEQAHSYETYASPTLYAGQTVTVCACCPDGDGLRMRPYVWYTDLENTLHRICGPWEDLGLEIQQVGWLVPEDCNGLPILRFGLEFTSRKRFDGSALIKSVDWSNTPCRIQQSGLMMRDMWDLDPFWAKMFVASAQQFAPNLNCTYCISHPEPGGLATIGTRDFTDYTVSSRLKFSLHRRGGLVARSRGHRRFYAAVVSGGDTFQIVKRYDDRETVLAQGAVAYRQFEEYPLRFTVQGNTLEATFAGVTIRALDADAPYESGAAGFMVDEGSIYINGFLLEKDG